MKLVIVFSIIAYGYADKLDRAYLPPASAATAGGSPGALTAPGASISGQPGSTGPAFGLPSGRQPGASSGQANPTYGSQNGPGFGQAGAGVGQSGTGIGQAGTGVGQAGTGFGQAVTGFGQGRPSGNLPGSGLQTTRPTYGVPEFGTGTQGASGINQFQSGSGLNAPSSNGRVPLLGANAPFGTAPNTFGTSPGADTFSAGAQQSYRPGVTSSQGFGQESQGFNVPQAQAYKPERPQAAADRNAEILKYVNENNGESYLYSYETSNGISAEESGVATNGVKAQGGYSYTGDDGKSYSVTYTADENGFQPKGEHLPTPHPIPEEILKSIEENARAAAAGTQEGAYRPEEYESEGPSQQYNVGSTSFNRPQGQSQGYGQGPITQGQSNQYSVNQGAFGPSGQSGQVSNQYTSGPSGLQGQIDQYQQGPGSNQGPANQFGSPAQIGQVAPSQGSGQYTSGQPGPQGQSGQYQTGIGSNQGPFSQSSGQGSIGQGIGQPSQAQGSNGYDYNQPQNAFGTVTQFGSASGQNPPQANIGQTTSTLGSQNQAAFGLQSGKVPSKEISFGTPQTSLGQSQNLNRPGSKPSGSSGVFGGNKPFGLSQGSQVRPGSQSSSIPSSSESSGYQYGANANRPTFGNRPNGINSQGSQYRPNAKQPSTDAINGSTQFGSTSPGSNGQIGQGQQYQQNGNRPFGGNAGSNQGTSSLGGSFGVQKPGSGSSFGQTNQPSFGSNVGPSQASSQFGQGSQQSTSAQGSSAPYQYNKPSQSFPTQQKPGSPEYSNANGPSGSQDIDGRPSTSSFGSQGMTVRPGGVSSQGPQSVEGQRPGYPGSQGTSGRPTFTGTQAVSGQRPSGGSSGPISAPGQQPGGNFPGSQGVIGQGPAYPGTQGANIRPDGVSPGSQGVSGQRPGSPGFSAPSQGNQGRPEQFGGPRQPPSFNPQEGYKY